MNQHVVKLNLPSLTNKSVERSINPRGFDHPLEAWSVLEWGGACAGEVGEAVNVAKKMSRFDKGFSVAQALAGKTRSELREMLADEMADSFLYLLLWAASEGINLGDVVMKRFNEKSDEIGYEGKFSLYVGGELV